ncbi:DUF2238 domain-containing protein [Bacillus sp. REN10]|uniref:DUF2238 domain-containing protein n=1 Tax=Bacillus sp. REN10 TaxID=2782541 RepID=UPI00193C5E8D
MKNLSQRNRIHLYLLFIVIAVFIWSIIKPASYSSWALEVVPALIGLIIVIATYNRFRFTTLSYTIMAILAVLMFIGGHYTYSDVPLFEWLQDQLDLKRNDYDRFGHFLKGLFAIVIREIVLRKTPITAGAWLFFIVVSIMLAISALYEIIEWLAFKIAKGGKVTQGFLGMQGDQWDAQWDMSLTLVGSILTLLFLSRIHDRFLKEIKK